MLEWVSQLQGNFLTQESNQGLLHCRRILYQLSYQGSPTIIFHLFLVVIGPGDGAGPREEPVRTPVSDRASPQLCVCVWVFYLFGNHLAWLNGKG